MAKASRTKSKLPASSPVAAQPAPAPQAPVAEGVAAVPPVGAGLEGGSQAPNLGTATETAGAAASALELHSTDNTTASEAGPDVAATSGATSGASPVAGPALDPNAGHGGSIGAAKFDAQPQAPLSMIDGWPISPETFMARYPLLAASAASWSDSLDEGEYRQPIVRITSKAEGFRRGGIAHSKIAVDHPIGTLRPEAIEAMLAEPMLKVELI